MVTYAGSVGKDGFYDVTQLSDGTFLVSGYAESLSWIDATIPRFELTYSGTIPNSLGTNRFGYLLHFSSDFQNLSKPMRCHTTKQATCISVATPSTRMTMMADIL
jgi:hypothetical protein